MKKPLDLTPYPQDPRSTPISAATVDGGYVYVQDEHGVVFVLPDAPHVHPKVLGGGRQAMYAGDLTVKGGKVTDLTNLSGTFLFDDEEGLKEVAAQIKRQGMAIEVGAVRMFPLDGESSGIMAMILAILEDNVDRQKVMRSVLADRFHQYELRIFDDAREMIRFLDNDLEQVLAIALDHDLELLPDGKGGCIDPGTGRQVADYLATRAPVAPVIIHTTNAPAGLGMETVLTEAGWKTYSVSPYGATAWIKRDWFQTMRNAIVDAVPTVESRTT